MIMLLWSAGDAHEIAVSGRGLEGWNSDDPRSAMTTVDLM